MALRSARRVFRRRFAVAALVLMVAAAATGLARRDDALYPGDGVADRWVAVVDHGWHAGLVVSAADLRMAAVMIGREDPASATLLRQVAAHHPHAPFFEIGWGEAEVYRSVRRIEDLETGLVFSALLWPTPSVMHVVPVYAPPSRAFSRAEQVQLALSPDGFVELAAGIAATLSTGSAGDPIDLGPGLYGDGRFYAAEPSYSLLHTCNHWIAGLLRAAGVPSSGLFSAWSGSLLAELRLRTNDRAL
ncbi:MAG: DUF2459 domain-containing protein [Pseudomonadota bacterium]